MKRILIFVFFTIVGLSTTRVWAHDSESNKAAVSSSKQTAATAVSAEEMQQMVNRVYEIQKMDKSNLTSAQRKELKKELIVIKERVSKDPVVFVFSSAGLVLLIVLLILLL